jgi:hypothetical protein
MVKKRILENICGIWHLPKGDLSKKIIFDIKVLNLTLGYGIQTSFQFCIKHSTNKKFDLYKYMIIHPMSKQFKNYIDVSISQHS